MLGPKVAFYGQHDPSVWAWGVRSFSDWRTRYDVTIDLGTGLCECGCMHFQCRLRKTKPTILEACKHVREVVLEAERRMMRRREDVA